MNRSLIISSVLHAALIFVTAMSLPFLAKKPLDIPPMVSVELIQIAEKTNIPFAPKAKKILKKVKEKEKKLVSDNGFEFLVNLPETKSLSENQAFRLQSGNLILIKNKKESLLEIKGKNLMQLIWHIGNRHMPCQIEKDRIFIQYDEVIKKMILKLGGKVKKVFKTFQTRGRSIWNW